MADVLLVNAHWGDLFSGRVRRYNRAFPPLELLNCAALLRQAGHRVRLVDSRARPDLPIPRDYDLAFVTLSPLDRWQCPNTDLDAAARFLRPFDPARLVLMGAQVTVATDALLARFPAHGALLGEPETGIVALADGAEPGVVPGSAGRRGAETVMGPSALALDVKALPVPAFDLMDFRDYRYEVLGDRLGLLELTRGCPWRCKFCLLTMYGKKYRKKTVPQMMAEIAAARAAGMKRAYFQDLEMTADRELVLELCEALRSTYRDGEFEWACQTRPDTVDGPLLVAMKRAGCSLIHYGVESGVERVVATTGKGQSLAAVEAGVALAHAAGMRTLCYFLLGLPGETLDEMWRTLAFAERVRPTYASFQVATPYPTTPFHAEFHHGDPAVFPDQFDGPLGGDALRALARTFTRRYHTSPRYVRTRLAGPGRRNVIAELLLLLRYLR